MPTRILAIDRMQSAPPIGRVGRFIATDRRISKFLIKLTNISMFASHCSTNWQCFRASEHDWENFDLEKEDEKILSENLEPRPGTKRRRQNHYKRVSSSRIFA